MVVYTSISHKGGLNMRIITTLLFIAVTISASQAKSPSTKEFFKAVEKGDAKRVSEMLGKGFNINTIGANGRTALHIAVLNNKTDIITLLLEKKPDLNVKDTSFGSTPLGYAVSKKYQEAVKLLLGGKPDLKTGSYNLPLLFIAVETGDTVIFQLLIDAGIDLNQKIDGYDGVNNVSALLCAVKYGYTGMVKLLLEKGADINHADSLGDPVIIWAVYYDQPETAELLLDSSDNIELNPEGANGTALAIAERKGYTKLVERIKKRGGRM
jgi:ankyrin repeat protein